MFAHDFDGRSCRKISRTKSEQVRSRGYVFGLVRVKRESGHPTSGAGKFVSSNRCSRRGDIPSCGAPPSCGAFRCDLRFRLLGPLSENSSCWGFNQIIRGAAYCQVQHVSLQYRRRSLSMQVLSFIDEIIVNDTDGKSTASAVRTFARHQLSSRPACPTGRLRGCEACSPSVPRNIYENLNLRKRDQLIRSWSMFPPKHVSSENAVPVKRV